MDSRVNHYKASRRFRNAGATRYVDIREAGVTLRGRANRPEYRLQAERLSKQAIGVTNLIAVKEDSLLHAVNRETNDRLKLSDKAEDLARYTQ